MLSTTATINIINTATTITAISTASTASTLSATFSAHSTTVRTDTTPTTFINSAIITSASFYFNVKSIPVFKTSRPDYQRKYDCNKAQTDHDGSSEVSQTIVRSRMANKRSANLKFTIEPKGPILGFHFRYL